MEMTTSEDTTMPESTEAEETMPMVSSKYEIMVIISSTITDEEIQERLKGIKDLLGSEIVFEEKWGMRPFAFPIKKQSKGYYTVWNFMADVETVKGLEDSFKLYPDLLRYLILKVPENYKPIPLTEIEAGLEKLRKEKEEKRGQNKSGPKKRDDKKKPEPKAEAKPSTTESTAPKEDTVKEESPAKEETPKEEPKRAKTLDEKLDDILSDADLGI